MSANFAVSVDPERDLVLIEMSGFFSDTDVAAFVEQLGAEMQALRCPTNQHLTLCDVSAMKIQAQDIVSRFAKVVGDPRFRSKRLAFLTGSTLARLQTQRLTDREGVKFFKDRAEAQSWLFG